MAKSNAELKKAAADAAKKRKAQDTASAAAVRQHASMRMCPVARTHASTHSQVAKSKAKLKKASGKGKNGKKKAGVATALAVAHAGAVALSATQHAAAFSTTDVGKPVEIKDGKLTIDGAITI